MVDTLQFGLQVGRDCLLQLGDGPGEEVDRNAPGLGVEGLPAGLVQHLPQHAPDPQQLAEVVDLFGSLGRIYPARCLGAHRETGVLARIVHGRRTFSKRCP